jgi:hypothetical protein
LRYPGPRLFVTPEIGIYDGTVLAGINLTQVRTSVAIGYRCNRRYPSFQAPPSDALTRAIAWRPREDCAELVGQRGNVE